MNKGISPILAAVILIAIVIGIANIAGPWFQDFFTEMSEDVAERGAEAVDCNRVIFDFRYDDIRYYTDDMTNELESNIINITVHNEARDQEIYGFNVYHVINSELYDTELLNDVTEENAVLPGSRITLVSEVVDGGGEAIPAENLGMLEEVIVSLEMCPIRKTCQILEGDC